MNAVSLDDKMLFQRLYTIYAREEHSNAGQPTVHSPLIETR